MDFINNVGQQISDIRMSNQILAILIFFLVSYIGILIIVKKRLKDERLKNMFYEDNFSSTNNIIDKINEYEESLGFLEKVQRELKQARSKMTVQAYIVILIASVIGIIAISNMLLGNIFLALPTGFGGIFIPKLILRNQREKFIEKFDTEMIKALRRMSSVLRSGGSLDNALKDVINSNSIPQIVKDEFSNVYVTYKAGFSIQQAFYQLYESIGSPDTLYLCVAIDVQMEVGGDKAEIFDSIASTISNRNLRSASVRAKLKEMTMTSSILSLMPIPFSILLFIFNPSHFDYFRASMQGRLLGFGIVGLIVGGFFINKELAKVKL